MISQTHNRDLMGAARVSLRGKWGAVAGTTLIYFVIFIGLQFIPIAGGIIQIVITGPMALGLTAYFLRLSRGHEAQLGIIFSGFEDFGRAFLTYLLSFIYIVLWTLLLIIPGILASLSYALVYYVLLDNPTIGANEAIGVSKKLMYGNRWKFFCLSWRFFGWYLLVFVTFGIAIFWVYPYMMTSFAKFYDDVKGELPVVEPAPSEMDQPVYVR